MTYWIFLLPIIAGILTQLIKVVIELIKGNFSWHVLKRYGGMPSSHAALVFALLSEVAYVEGMASAAFAIALILAVLIIRDATGYRRLMDKHAKIINTLVNALPDKEQINIPHLDDNIGHSPFQVFVGAGLGIIIVIIGNFLI